jgi:D-tyrosyl-tRNA(Tyr) deacylase
MIGLLQRASSARVVVDGESIAAIGPGLLVPQFTLAADTRSGTRPGFSPAAVSETGAMLFAHMVARARALHAEVGCGRFGADMQVTLTNDGPVTFWLQVRAAD